MLPHERSLVTKYANRPFALVGVSHETNKDAYRKMLAEGAMTWRSWFDSKKGTPIQTAWNVNSLPTLYVLDANGVIRFRDVHGANLEEAVAALVAEAEERSPAPAK